MKHLICIFLALGLVGCVGTRPLKPGRASIQSGAMANGAPAFAAEMKQPENPAQAAQQNLERVTETELPLPAQSMVREVIITPPSRPGVEPVRQEKIITLAEPTVQKTRMMEKAGTVIGAAQKDTARELGAKLASLKGIVWLGAGLFVFGLASLVWPPLKAIIGSVTTSAAILLGGIALMVLPSLVVGNELLILSGVGLGVGAWFLAHRHGRLQGLVDANQNGIDDRLEQQKS